MKYLIEYGSDFLEFDSEHPIEVIGMSNPPAPVPMPDTIEKVLINPIHSESLLKLAKSKIKQNLLSQAVIVVSDNTRPVPYYGREGILIPIIEVLLDAGFSQDKVTILIGAGSHRNMEADEIEAMIGLSALGFSEIKVVNHEYDDEEKLIFLGQTSNGSDVYLNRDYYMADLKIVTGLVESHFMAGASGGRKGICPGIVGIDTLTIFHGGRFLSSLMAADLILEGNPLHDEASEVASLAGCDFLVNVTLDNDKRVTGVFAGDLFMAHQEAVAKIKDYVVVPLPQRYDIVLIPAGFVGINHYQGAKAATEAARAVKEGGKIIIVAKNNDVDPVGGLGYKEALQLLAREGSRKFQELILTSHWKIIQEQWQVQMWCKVFDVIKEEKNLYYCSLEIPEPAYDILPGVAGIKMLAQKDRDLPAEKCMKLMIEKALTDAIKTSDAKDPSILLLKDGPYGIPQVI